jgi:hypothetical protein
MRLQADVFNCWMDILFGNIREGRYNAMVTTGKVTDPAFRRRRSPMLAKPRIHRRPHRACFYLVSLTIS